MRSDSQTSAIALKNVGKAYNRGTRFEQVALENVDLEVAAGQFISIVGPVGCGKTTLLRLIAGLEPPTSGAVIADGQEVTGPNYKRGMVFEESLLFPWMNVMDNVMFGMLCTRVPRQEAEDRAIDWLRFLGLDAFRRHYPHQLSGGMQRRVAIARAVANDPDVLLCDEPFSGLDWITREAVLDELLRVWDRSKKTIVYVTHALEEAVYASQKVYLMTARPGTLAQSFDIQLPLRRWEDRQIRFSEQCAHYIEQVRRAFKREAEAR